METDEPPSSGSSQTIVIIALIIIGIILFIVLLVITIDIPLPIIKPFADGTIIKIKSLANGKYLIPRLCSQVPACTIISQNGTEICNPGDPNFTPTLLPIVADGNFDDESTNWVVCQHPDVDKNQAEAAYYLSNNTSTSQLAIVTWNSILVSKLNSPTCIAEQTSSFNCNQIYELFNFELIENVNPNANSNVSGTNGVGTYTIRTAIIPGCSESNNPWYWVNNSSGVVCSNIMELSQTPSEIRNPQRIINYSFQVEVVGRQS